MTGTTTLRIAWRNRRRTALALAAIGLSVTLVLAYNAMIRAYSDWLLDTVTGPLLGHVQVHAPGWRKDRSVDRTLGHVSRTLQALQRDPEIASASARLYAPALAALGEEGFAVLVVGLDPAAESRPSGLLAGVPTPFGGRRVLLGRQAGEMIGAREGDTLALVGQGADGSLANDLFTVAALADTPVDLVNRQGVVMDLAEAQALFAMPDEAHEIVVHARNPQQLDALVARVARLPEVAGQEVLDWQRLSPEMKNLVNLMGVMGLFTLVLVFIAAAAGIANTMLMATFERTHEFGMLLALGTGPRRIVGMVLAEAVVLGVAGALIGAAIGVALVVVTHATGIDYAALTGGGPNEISSMGLRWTLRFRPTLAPIDVVAAVVAVIVTSLVAAAWPAARAARLQPARALRE